MNALSSGGTVVAAIMAIMTTVVSWRALRDHSTLDNPMISVCIGLLTFIGLQYLPEGLANTILIGYVALAIAILFVLIITAFGRARRPPFLDDLAKLGEKQTRRKRLPRDDLASPSSGTERQPRHRRQTSDEDSSIP